MPSAELNFDTFGVPFALAKHLKGRPPLSLIDLGAHQGGWTHALDRFCGVSRGVMVELQPTHAAYLREHFVPPRFQVVEAAITDHGGEMEVEVNGFDPTTSILATLRDSADLVGIDVRPATRVVCVARTLDDVFSETGLSQLDLLKMDIQGAEHLAIRGGKRTIAATAMIWTEISFKQLYEGACMYHEIIDLLKGAGFALFEIDPGFRNAAGELVQADALFIRQ